MKYSEIIEFIAYSIADRFSEVYHSAEIVISDSLKQPAIAVGDEWISLVPTDQKEIIYIRRNGDDETVSDSEIGSCAVSYKMRTPLRIVYFKDHVESHDEIISRLMKSLLLTNVKLRSIVRDKWKLLKEESSGDYKFGASTAYVAIDVYAIWRLLPSNCDEDFCLKIDNPLKSESGYDCNKTILS